jgi:hypothetical protein
MSVVETRIDMINMVMPTTVPSALEHSMVTPQVSLTIKMISMISSFEIGATCCHK